jgi:hypothetical protein
LRRRRTTGGDIIVPRTTATETELAIKRLPPALHDTIDTVLEDTIGKPAVVDLRTPNPQLASKRMRVQDQVSEIDLPDPSTC